MANANFAKYLAMQIYKGNLEEEKVMKLYPKYADEVKKYLEDWNNQIPYVPGR